MTLLRFHRDHNSVCLYLFGLRFRKWDSNTSYDYEHGLYFDLKRGVINWGRFGIFWG